MAEESVDAFGCGKVGLDDSDGNDGKSEVEDEKENDGDDGRWDITDGGQKWGEDGMLQIEESATTYSGGS